MLNIQILSAHDQIRWKIASAIESCGFLPDILITLFRALKDEANMAALKILLMLSQTSIASILMLTQPQNFAVFGEVVCVCVCVCFFFLCVCVCVCVCVCFVFVLC